MHMHFIMKIMTKWKDKNALNFGFKEVKTVYTKRMVILTDYYPW